MTKTRFTAADVRAMVRDLRATVHGLRVVNVYDLDAKVNTAAVQYSVVENHSKIVAEALSVAQTRNGRATEIIMHMFGQTARSSLEHSTRRQVA